jgi:hypothetical protein
MERSSAAKTGPANQSLLTRLKSVSLFHHIFRLVACTRRCLQINEITASRLYRICPFQNVYIRWSRPKVVHNCDNDAPTWRNGYAIACRAIPIRFDSGRWLLNRFLDGRSGMGRLHNAEPCQEQPAIYACFRGAVLLPEA